MKRLYSSTPSLEPYHSTTPHLSSSTPQLGQFNPYLTTTPEIMREQKHLLYLPPNPYWTPSLQTSPSILPSPNPYIKESPSLYLPPNPYRAKIKTPILNPQWNALIDLPLNNLLPQCLSKYKVICKNNLFWQSYFNKRFSIPLEYGSLELAIKFTEIFENFNDTTIITKRAFLAFAEAFNQGVLKDFVDFSSSIITIDDISKNINISKYPNFNHIKYLSRFVNEPLPESVNVDIINDTDAIRENLLSPSLNEFYLEIIKLKNYVFVPCEYITKNLEIITIDVDYDRLICLGIAANNIRLNGILNIFSYPINQLNIQGRHTFNDFFNIFINSKKYELITDFKYKLNR